MRVLIACEFSGVVRDAFIDAGYDATSCDIIDSWSDKGPHYTGDVREILGDGWDLMIAHPPCRYLTTSGARWWPDRQQEQKEALDFVQELLDAPIEHIALENPPGKIGSAIRKADQYVHPYEFGDPVRKRTGWWLKNLPNLVPTEVLEDFEDTTSNVSEGPNQLRGTAEGKELRSRLRSVFHPGMAAAMASQWGNLLGQPRFGVQLQLPL